MLQRAGGTAPLNLASGLPSYTIAPDLGPKGYIAYGRCAVCGPGSAGGVAGQRGGLVFSRVEALLSRRAGAAACSRLGFYLHPPSALHANAVRRHVAPRHGTCPPPTCVGTPPPPPACLRREGEHAGDGDSVTKLHEDLSDAGEGMLLPPL